MRAVYVDAPKCYRKGHESMKRILLSVTLCLVACVFALQASNTARAAETLTFTLVNKTGYGITKLFVAPHSSQEWDKDDELLKGRAFGDGVPVKISYHTKTTATAFDFKASWADGDADSEWSNVQLENGATYIMTYDKKSDKASIHKE